MSKSSDETYLKNQNEKSEDKLNESDEEPQLSSDTMNALIEFYKEQEDREKKRLDVLNGIVPTSFEENWNMSQFWYSEETAEALAKEVIRQANGGEVACISCPTLYKSICLLKESQPKKLFEFDTRFAVYKEDFILYDYKSPLDIPRDLRERFSLIVADPPYLSDDCLTKTAMTIKFLSKPNSKIILCTGEIMADLAYRLLTLSKCSFQIKHNKMLSNPFACYANYDLDNTCK